MTEFNPEWENIHQNHSWATQPDQYLTAFLAKNAIGQNLHFLDVGCGVGANTVPLIKEGHRVTAFDGSKTAIKKLMENAGDLGHLITPICADLAEIEFEENSFDYALDIATFGEISLEGACSFAARAHRWLKPNGVFFSRGIAHPTNPSLIRTSSFRYVDLQSLSRIFKDYKCRCYSATGSTMDGRVLTSWITEATKMEDENEAKDQAVISNNI